MLDALKTLIRNNNPRYWRARCNDAEAVSKRRLQQMSRLAQERDGWERGCTVLRADLSDATQTLDFERAAHRVTASRLEEEMERSAVLEDRLLCRPH